MNQKIPVFYIHGGNQKEMFASIDQVKDVTCFLLWDSLKALWSKYSFDLKKIWIKKLPDPLMLEFYTPEKKFHIKFQDQNSYNNYYSKILSASLVFKDNESIDSLNLQMSSAWPFPSGKIY